MLRFLTQLLLGLLMFSQGHAAPAGAMAGGGWQGAVAVAAPGGERSLLAEAEPLAKVLQRYLSNEELEAHLRDFVGRCGEIAALRSIGKSVEGRDLWVLEISDKPGTPEPEPAVKYVGGVHGDEPTGRVLALALAEWLCANWRTDPQAKRVVTELHLHLLPAMNPDGFAAKSRENKGDRDLNRDFPDRYGADIFTSSGREQPETRAVMDWTLQTGFVASASFHEGAVVANYPWDGTPNRTTQYWACPDDAAFKHLAKTYAKGHRTMASSKEFQDGITNGAAWYPIYGSMQDWNYVVASCFEVTLELSDNKWPPEPGLAALFADNRQGLIDFALTAALGGLRGTVKGQATKLRAGKGQEVTPLPGANITVVGLDGAPAALSRAPFGDFYRPLAPGGYGVLVTAEGYSPFSANITVPEDGSGAVLEVLLLPNTSSAAGAVVNAISSVGSIKESAKGGTATTAAQAAVGGGEAAGLARWHGKAIGKGGGAGGGGAGGPGMGGGDAGGGGRLQTAPSEPGALRGEHRLVLAVAVALVAAGLWASRERLRRSVRGPRSPMRSRGE